MAMWLVRSRKACQQQVPGPGKVLGPVRRNNMPKSLHSEQAHVQCSSCSTQAQGRSDNLGLQFFTRMPTGCSVVMTKLLLFNRLQHLRWNCNLQYALSLSLKPVSLVRVFTDWSSQNVVSNSLYCTVYLRESIP